MSEHVPTHKDRIDLAKKIWAIAGESPVMGNALMDVLGEKTYKKIMRLQAENPEHQPNPVVSDKCYTPFEYLTEFFPDAIKDAEKPVCCTHENIVSGLRVFLDESGNADMQNCWDYPLNEIDEIIENELRVVLVEDGKNNFRFFQIPE
jgi:hypothetical protein